MLPATSSSKIFAPQVALTLVSSASVTTSVNPFTIPGSYAGCVILVFRTFSSDDGITEAESLALIPPGYEGLNYRSYTWNVLGRSSWKRATTTPEIIDLSHPFLSHGSGSVVSTVYIFSPGAHPITPIGDRDDAGGDGRSATFDAMTLANANSFVAAVVRVYNSNETPSTPTGFTSLYSSWGRKSFIAGPIGTFAVRYSTIETSPAKEPWLPLPTRKWITLEAEVRTL